MKKTTLVSKLCASLACFAALFSGANQAKALSGIDPKNMGKGDWIWSVSISTSKLNNQVPGVTDIPSLMSYEKNQGMSYVIVKAGTGSTNYPSATSPQFTATLVNEAHKQGLKIFAYTRSYGTDIPGEIKLATNCLALGADGFVIDAEAEWESSRLGTNGPSRAVQLCTAIRSAYPTRILAHAPMPYISLHSSFPYKEFGYYCDFVMPQAYWNAFGITPDQMVTDLDSEWRNWQNGLGGTWTNAIKPIVPIAEGDNTNIPPAEISAFASAVTNDATPATIGGYKGMNFWDAHEHTSNQWPAIAAVAIGDSWSVPDVIVDNSAATMVGSWTLGTSSADKYATDYRSKGQGTGAASLTFTPNLPVTGNYKVYEWHPKGTNRTTNAPVTINYDGGSTTVKVNQQLTGGSWVLLGTFPFQAGTAGTVTISDATPDATFLVMADAVRFSYVLPTPPAPSNLTATFSAGPQISLSWTDNATDEFDYVVARSTTAGGPYTDIATLPANSTNFVDTALSATTTYYYAVRAENHAGYSANSSEASATTDSSVADIIVDNNSATITGSWSIGTGSPDKFGADYRFKSQGTGSASLLYTPNIFTPGDYNIYEWHPQGGNRTVGAPHIINYNGGTATLNVNQQVNGGKWNLLGTFNLAAGQNASVRITDGFADAGQLVMADAIKFSYVPAITAPNAPSGLSATAAGTSQINLSWTDNANNEDNYVASRSTVSGGPYNDIATLPSNTTAYSDSGLSAGTSYFYVVRAINAGGSSALSAQASATTTVAAPTAPSGLTATTASASQIDLSWTDNSSNETSFVVARSTTSGGPYTDVATVGANVTAYSNSSLAANTTYYYVVRAVNAGGSSANAAQTSSTTLPNPPAAPSGLAVSAAGATQLNLSWTDNASDETGFVVSRSSTAGGPYTDIATLGANVTSYGDTGLSANTTYYYVVRASNSGGSSANSAEANGTTLPNAPAAPSGLVVSVGSSTQLNLSWTDNASNETGYVVARSTTAGGPYTDIATLGANVTAYSNSGLTANTTYYYVVRASNSGGSSANSAEASGTTLPNPPAAPSGLIVSVASSTQLNLSWTDNASNETGYVVARSTTAGGPYTDIATLGANATAYSNSGLTANTTYYYVVRASNSGGSSANSAEANGTTLPNAPTAPSGLTANAVSASQINLTWVDNASNETGFVVARSSTSGGPYTDIATLGVNATAYSDTGLTPNTTYYYVVRATNTGGDSANSAQRSATTLPLPPAAPSGLAASTVSASQVSLSWTDNSANETSFVVARSTTSGGPYADIATLGANVTTYNDSSLLANTTYYYVVRAANSGGSSANSAQASATTLPLPPTAPSALTATTISASQINLAWTDNSANETSFVVARSATAGGPYTDIATLAANSTSYNNTGLTAGTTYYYVVRAANSGGSSANSAEGSATTLPLAPAAPSALVATAVSASQIDLSWADNSSNETSFVVARSTTSGGPYTDIATVGANTTSYSNTGLAANTTYYYVVRAANSGGTSANTAQASIMTFETNLLIDNNSAVVVGAWSTSSSSTDKYGTNYRFASAGTGANYVQFTPSITTAGVYQVYEWHPQGANRTTAAPLVVSYNGGTTTNLVNQQINGGKWNLVGTYNFAAGNSGNIKITDAFTGTNVVMADAIQLVLVPAAPAPTGLTATAASSTQINLSWVDNATNETSFVVARSTTSGGPYTDIATLGANTTSYSNTGLSANTTYYYVVRCINAGGASANSTQASATTLQSVPAAPSALTATVISTTQINLSWTDNSANETGFVVGRSTVSGGPYTDVVTNAANVTTFNNTGLAPSTTYYYVVRAVNAGGASANTAQASGTTLSPAPNAPTGLTATALSSSSIKLTWIDNASNESNFIVGRSSTSGGPYTDIATLGANVVSYTNTALVANTTYYYVVRASNGNGSSTNSTQASATTLNSAPAAPSALAASALSSTSIKLTWTDNSANETSFVVARGTTSGGPYTDVATLGANTTSYTNSSLTPNKAYFYVVRAVNSGGSSANSAQATATTPAVADIIIDNPAATVTGTWSTGTSSTDKFGTDYRFKSAGTGTSFLSYTPNIITAGNYQVYEYHPQGSNRPTNAPVVVTFNGGSQTVRVNQQINGGKWNLVGTYNFNAGTVGDVKITDNFTGTGLSVMADGIKFVWVP